jgi:peroxiredoxin
MPKSETLLKVGDRAPDFTLQDYNDKPFTLSEIVKKGKVLLLFFRGTW